MRNILITVMMLVVVAVLFTAIISDDSTGLKARIEQKGIAANNHILNLGVE